MQASEAVSRCIALSKGVFDSSLPEREPPRGIRVESGHVIFRAPVVTAATRSQALPFRHILGERVVRACCYRDLRVSKNGTAGVKI
jgi:hypothetical protein